MTRDHIYIPNQAPGDMDYATAGGEWTRLPIGSSTQVLVVTNGIPTWTTIGWTTYAPTVKQSGTLQTVTVTRARYSQINKIIHFVCMLTVSNATGAVAGNDIEIGLPVSASAAGVTNFDIIGGGHIFDSSAGLTYRGLAFATAAGFCKLQPTNDTANGFLGTIQLTAALAASDVLRVHGTYEVD